MSIILTPKHEAWLNERISHGEFESPDDAIAQLIETWTLCENDDLAWAKPLVDEALAQVERGEVMSLEEHKSRMAERLVALRG